MKYYKVIYTEGKPLILKAENKKEARKHGVDHKKMFFPWEAAKITDVQEMPEAEFTAICDQVTKAFLATMNIKNTRKEETKA